MAMAAVDAIGSIGGERSSISISVQPKLLDRDGLRPRSESREPGSTSRLIGPDTIEDVVGGKGKL